MVDTAAISPGEKARLEATRECRFGERQRSGCLAGTADREIADADDGRIDSLAHPAVKDAPGHPAVDPAEG
jgi:hypothetical protein